MSSTYVLSGARAGLRSTAAVLTNTGTAQTIPGVGVVTDLLLPAITGALALTQADNTLAATGTVASDVVVVPPPAFQGVGGGVGTTMRPHPLLRRTAALAATEADATIVAVAKVVPLPEQRMVLPKPPVLLLPLVGKVREIQNSNTVTCSAMVHGESDEEMMLIFIEAA